MMVFNDWSVSLNAREAAVVAENLAKLEKQASKCFTACENELCRHPLDDKNVHTVIGIGRVCDLCHDMWWALKQRNYWARVQEQFNTEQARKRKMIDGDDKKFN